MKGKFISGMPINKDLGIYLGVPIIHGRLKKNHFKFVVEKVRRKLACWKAKSLTFMSRATLVQSISSTIANYNMNTIMIPQSICVDIDKINRNFLWGDTEDKKKVHLIKWKKLCNLKGLVD